MDYQLDELSRIERLAKAMNEFQTGRRGNNSLTMRERGMALAQAFVNLKAQAAHPDVVRITGMIDMNTVKLAEECPTCSRTGSHESVQHATMLVAQYSAQILAAAPATKVIPATVMPSGEYAAPGVSYRPKKNRS